MSQFSLRDRLLRLEDWRLRQHFKRVEQNLRSRDVSHLSPALQQAREHYLDRLHRYAARGIFPRNYERPVYSPCFIDRDGRECAVAHLVMVSGHADLANHVANVANYAYVPQMTFPELDDWTSQAGLTREELARIQPGYYTPFDASLFVLWTAELLAILINAVHIARRRTGIIMPVIGLIITIVFLWLAFILLTDSSSAYYLGTHPDTPSDQKLIHLHEAGLLALGGAISLILAFIAGGLGIYRIRDFNRARWGEE
jgi:hypothetical protein